MAKGKNRKSSAKAPAQVSSKPLDKKPFIQLPSKLLWMQDSRFLIPVILYVIMLFVWSESIFGGLALNMTGDRIAAFALRRIVASTLAQGFFPFWNPYFYTGMAMFESFQSSWLLYPGVWLLEGFVPDAAHPGFFNGGLAWLLFFNSPVDFLLMHHLIGAIGVMFLVRHFGGKFWVQLACSIAFLLSPQLVILSDVGHGSKLYDMIYLPWLLFVVDRAFNKITPMRLAAVGLVFGLLMSAQHIQVAYYGYMMIALWWMVRQILNFRDKNYSNIGKQTGVFVFSLFIGIAATAVLYLNTLSYAQDTIRGHGGVGWDYATNWSYHPLESISMFVPDFFGFGGQDYWGYMTWTDMPLYWGIPITVFAVFAVILVRKWYVYGLFAVGFLAWVTSFGKFLPILYRPFYDFLPYFNKFRVPMMIHILVLLAAVVLAGIGMQKILDIINSKDEELRRKWRRILLYTLATAGFFLLFIILGQGMIKANIESWVNSTHPDRAQAAMQYRNYNGPTQLAEMAMISIYRSMIMLKFTLATIWLSLFRRMPKFLPGLVIAILLLVDLGSMTDKLIHPKSLNIIERAFVSDPVSEKLSGDINSRAKVFGIMEMYSIIEGTMRMGQIDGATANQMLAQVQQNLRGMRAVNVWGAEGVQIQEGYTGSKPSWYGYLEEKRALSHPTIMAVTGVNYLIAPGEIPGSVPVAGKSGGYGGLLYKNPNTLPMAYLRSRWVVIDDLQTTLDTLLTPGYDYTRNLILNKEPQGVTKDTAVTGEAKLVERIGNTAKIEVQSDKAAILVFADSYSSAGWKAFVNGTETEILRANGITRAIAVPAGSSTIEFIYKPAHWGISLLITIIAWACIIGLFVWGLLVHLKNRGDISDPVAI